MEAVIKDSGEGEGREDEVQKGDEVSHGFAEKAEAPEVMHSFGHGNIREDIGDDRCNSAVDQPVKGLAVVVVESVEEEHGGLMKDGEKHKKGKDNPGDDGTG